MASEEAAFCKQFRADPVPGAIVYVQYGASQPEFLELGRSAMEGFCWSTVLGVYGDKMGEQFRKDYLKRFPEYSGSIDICLPDERIKENKISHQVFVILAGSLRSQHQAC